jgi:hypothetical protein
MVSPLLACDFAFSRSIPEPSMSRTPPRTGCELAAHHLGCLEHIHPVVSCAGQAATRAGLCAESVLVDAKTGHTSVVPSPWIEFSTLVQWLALSQTGIAARPVPDLVAPRTDIVQCTQGL